MKKLMPFIMGGLLSGAAILGADLMFPSAAPPVFAQAAIWVVLSVATGCIFAFL